MGLLSLLTFAVLFAGFGKVAVVALVVLVIVRKARSRRRNNRSMRDPRQCPVRDCRCVNPVEARFCRRCGTTLPLHRKAARRQAKRVQRRAAA